MKQITPYKLIDTAGQTTAVVDVPVKRIDQPKVAKPIMQAVKYIGQVCFKVTTSGLNKTVTATKQNNSVSIALPKRLSGIKLVPLPGPVKEKLTPRYKEILLSLSKNSPAAGIIFYKAGAIQPLIYVKATMSKD